jgi:hypothetical protein
MSKLVEEDVVDGCTGVSKVEPEGIQHPQRAIYSYTAQSHLNKEIALGIWELSSLDPLSGAYKM